MSARHRHKDDGALTGIWLLLIAVSLTLALYLALFASPTRPALGAVIFALGAMAAAAARSVRHRRRRTHEPLERASFRQAAATRVFWEASGEFDAEGWARAELENLRLLCLNVTDDALLGPRVADRLKRACSAVLGGVVDRMDDVLSTGRQLALQPELLDRLSSARTVLLSQLGGAVCQDGEPPSFLPDEVATSAGQALETIAALRAKLRPQLITALIPLLGRVCGLRAPESLRSGELQLDLDELHDRDQVVVNARDLAQALSELLHRLVRTGGLTGPLRVSGSEDEGRLIVRLDWQTRDRWRLAPHRLLEPVRELKYYGVHAELHETIEHSEARLEISFPRADEERAAGGDLNQPRAWRTG
ncbi:MAG: hypothetical protein JSV80_10105 [Acidobacteriota bacterium]|nr:MAG: hypothetical protein JSV80_10105 [Acidobacteriota bacterium]